jgi:tetratricopeptide (TPR) repeat protein
LKAVASIIPIVIAVLTASACGATAQEISAPSMIEEHLASAEAAFDRAMELDMTDPQAAKDYYRKAILHYERLTDSGIRNGRLYYNIGNAWFRLDDMGRAILNYRRSALYNPADPNLEQNLQFARSRRINRIEIQQRDRVFKTLFFIHYDVPTRIRFGIFLAGFVLLWTAAIIAVFIRRGWIKTAIISLAVLCFVLLISLVWEKVSLTRNPAGVVTAAEVVARKGDAETYQPSFTAPLYSGTEFSLVEHRPDWWYIELEDGVKCWIPSGAGELVLDR